jgi:hypothetical protein
MLLRHAVGRAAVNKSALRGDSIGPLPKRAVIAVAAASVISSSLFGVFASDIAVVRTELSAAGFEKVGVEKVTKLLRASSAREAAVSLCHGGLVVGNR